MVQSQLTVCEVAAGIAELVQMLQSRKTAVYLVSGGFRPIINPIAEKLNIPQEHVYANTILHAVSTSQPCMHQNAVAHVMDACMCDLKQYHTMCTTCFVH